MKISYNWLRDFVEVNLKPAALAEALSMAGFEVDRVDESRLDIPGLIVGEVVSCEKHPDADRLSLCQVSLGSGDPLPIVCGAPNVAAGQRVAVATVGTELPGGMKIREAKIRGAVSKGMICSPAELGVSDEADGIWVLPSTALVGKPLAETPGFESDAVLDIGVTPNRPDALSHVGIAREVAAIVDKPLIIPEAEVPESPVKCEERIEVTIETPASCPRYAVRLIENVTIGPSPQWMARRLEAAGMRPINNLVDITNYVMLETGQPLHAFDYDLISGERIIVRESAAGERFTTLDEKEHALPVNTVMICDGERPVAIGGIMGGLNSEVSHNTRHILLESAYFSPYSIQKSARSMGFRTEASTRFEKGTDPNNVLYALDRAAKLFAEHAGGNVATGRVDVYPVAIEPARIDLDTPAVNRLIGIEISAAEMLRLLSRIGIGSDGNTISCPTFRPDLTQTADIAEEVARLYGYDRIPLSDGMEIPYRPAANPVDDFRDMVRDILVGIGCQEAVTNSMVNGQRWAQLTGETLYSVFNPISGDMSAMRNSLIPSLLEAVAYNLNRQIRDLSIFEINTTFSHPGDLHTRPEERTRLAIALTGTRQGEHWSSDGQLFDFYDIKGHVEFLVGKISLDNIQLITYDNFAVAEQAGRVLCAGEELGFVGRVRPELQNAFDIESQVFVAELDMDVLYRIAARDRRYQEIPKFPSIERDIAMVVSEGVTAREMLEEIRSNAGEHLSRLTLFDMYSGSQIEKGHKSLAFRMVFQSALRTLTEDEVNEAVQAVIEKLLKRFRATLRAN